MWGAAQTALILFVNLIISFAAGCATRREDYILALQKKRAAVICVLVQYVAAKPFNMVTGRFAARPLVVYILVKAINAEAPRLRKVPWKESRELWATEGRCLGSAEIKDLFALTPN